MQVEYDSCGRMMYHPEFHPNHGTPFTLEELEYICKFYDYDDPALMAMALGRTEASVRSRAYKLKLSGKFDYYKNLNRYW
jgi:hypothetical protein